MGRVTARKVVVTKKTIEVGLATMVILPNLDGFLDDRNSNLDDGLPEEDTPKVRRELEAALLFLVRSRCQGRKLETQGKVQLSIGKVVSIVKVLLLRLYPNKR